MDHSPLYWLRKWAREGAEETREHGLAGAREGITAPWKAAFIAANRALVDRVGNPGRPIYEPNWDVLVVLDACRVDLLKEAVPEYGFLPDRGIETFRSRASKSSDWMARNFTSDHTDAMARTAHVTGNPFSRDLDADDFAVLDEVWRYAWDDRLGSIPARPITDRAITTWRDRGESSTEQMIVHYMQPHAPFVTAPDLGSYGGPDEFGEGLESVWVAAGPTGLTREKIWPHYRDNLRYVLDDVAILLDNLDAESVVLTADHGNAVGEFGMWGHPSDLLLPCVRQVPWVEVGARDSGEYQPTTERPETVDTNDADVTNRLEALGYT